MIQKKSDDAISPVIGVMMMLVVTVVIAAAVTIFATGVVGETEPAPVAVLDVQILNQAQTLNDLVGPELFITHISGDPIDTADIEIRSSWTHKDENGNDCSHYSAYSAEGMKKEHPNGVEAPTGTPTQAMYVKTYKDGTLTHLFGEITLTPGLKLMAFSDILVRNAYNPESPMMDVIFNNYKVITTVNQKAETICQTEAYYTGHKKNANGEPEWDENCPYCAEYYSGMSCHVGWVDYLMNYEYPEVITDWNIAHGRSIQEGDCAVCAYKHMSAPFLHPVAECSPEKGCQCAQSTGNYVTTYTPGIMKHLQPGTAVDIMIVHIPSGKAIYDKTVIVQ